MFAHVLRSIGWWLEVHTGTVNEPGPYYGFWSGFGSFVPFAVPVTAWYWHHTCHVGRCLRPGKHEYEMDGVTRKLCSRHHPHVDGALTAQNVVDHHARATA